MSQNSIIRIHVDTEFTDFLNSDLISLGAIADNGETFYGENSEFVQAWASTWVKENIYPLLNFEKFGMKRLELSARFWSWIEELPCDSVILTVDNDIDIEIVNNLFDEDKHPKISSYQNINKVIIAECDKQIQAMDGNDELYCNLTHAIRKDFYFVFSNYFKRTNEIQHHALSDAKANREAYNFIVKKYGMPH